MSEEEMQRKMEFIVNQQAQFAADIQQLQESHSRLTDAMTTVVGLVGKIAEAQDRMAQEQERMAKEMAESQKRTDEKFAELATAQAETDERLNIFINVVERYINERRNGQNGRAQED